MLAGVLMTLGRYSQSENAWSTLFGNLSSQSTSFAGAVASGIAFMMQYLVQFSGATMFIGGLLSYKNHVRSGKELVGLGTGVGLADLLVGFTSGTLTLYQPLGWAGLAVAVFASRHLHGPSATYAEEVQKLFAAVKKRLVREEKTRRKRMMRRNVKRASLVRRSSARRRVAGPYNVRDNVKGKSQASPENDPAATES